MAKKRSKKRVRAVEILTVCAAAGCNEKLIVEPMEESTPLCEKCFERICLLCQTIGLHWFSAHSIPSFISWSSHPEILPPSTSKLVSSRTSPAQPAVSIEVAASLLRQAQCVCIVAGAGASADSGVPVFRGPSGFYRVNGIDIPMDAINFHQDRQGDLALAWGYLLKMMQSFDEKEPHDGYKALLKMVSTKDSFFVFTSNIDNYFVRAGFPSEQIWESHGNVETLQCVNYSTSKGVRSSCSSTIFPVKTDNDPKGGEWYRCAKFGADMKVVNLEATIPKCPSCGSLSRPNISHCTDLPEDICLEKKGLQEKRFRSWVEENKGKRLLVIEVGCGISEHSLRDESELICERLWENSFAKIVRIDPGNCDVAKGHIGIQLKAMEALLKFSAAYFPQEE